MIIKPQTKTTSANERRILRLALKGLIKRETSRMSRLTRQRYIDETEDRIAAAQDLLTKFSEDEATPVRTTLGAIRDKKYTDSGM